MWLKILKLKSKYHKSQRVVKKRTHVTSYPINPKLLFHQNQINKMAVLRVCNRNRQINMLKCALT